MMLRLAGASHRPALTHGQSAGLTRGHHRILLPAADALREEARRATAMQQRARFSAHLHGSRNGGRLARLLPFAPEISNPPTLWAESEPSKRSREMRAHFTAWLLTGALAAIVVVPAGAQSVMPSATDKVTINGWALNMSNIATGANQTIRINIDKWSNPSQRERLITTFLEKKQDGLLRELEKQPELGRFNFPGYMGPDPNNVMRLGTDIRYAMSFPGEDGGRRIVVITPRVIGFREAANRPRTYDYPFTLFEMRFDKSGKGEGRMAYATQINFDKKTNAIELENYSSEPVRLNNLELEINK
jgi:hypothetical protein